MMTGALNLGWGSRMPMVLQSEAAECGLACMAMVMAFHGQPTDLPALRRRFGVSLRGARLTDLARIANAVSLVPRPLRLELGELQHLKTPAILHWDLNHFVVLERLGRKGGVLRDPSVGVRSVGFAELSKHFTGVALELAPAAGITSMEPPPRVRLRALLGRIVGLWTALGRVFVIALGIEVAMALSPLYMQWVVDDAVVSGDRELLSTLAIGFGLLLMFRTLLAAMRGWVLLAVGASLRVQGRANLFAHLLELPAAFFEARQLGDVLSRFGSQETILQAFTTDLVEAVLDGVLAVVTLGLMFVFAPGLAAIVLVGTLLYAGLRWASFTPLRHASAETIAWSARRDTHFLETLRGMKTIKIFNAQDDRRHSWLNLLVETVNRQITTQKLQVVFTTSNAFLSGAIALLVVWLGARRVLDGGFTVGAMIAFVSYKDQFSTRITALIDKALDLQMLQIHGERLADIVLTEPEQRRGGVEDAAPARGKPIAIEMKGVRVRYSAHDPWVLDGVDLRVQPGESVAIIGASGCGKTTLLKVLASLIEPNEGEMLVDDQSLRAMGIARYRDMLGLVMQDDQLFAGSIADNISFFAPNPDPARIEECSRTAAVHDVVAAMPMGYATLIGDMGAALSGGQKQRILIARALYRRPGILLLDEATSHLDVERERAVNTAIRASSLTRIIVAHRPETIFSADRIVLLSNGKLVEQVRSQHAHPDATIKGTVRMDPSRPSLRL
jgi:ATP-binding cassette subfamily B protein RaxB